MRKLLVIATLGVLATVAGCSGCGDDEHVGPDSSTIDADVDAPPPDAMPPPDAPVCPAREVGEVGGPCTTHAQCDSEPGAGDGVCYRGALGVSVFAPEGFCTIEDFKGGVACDVDADCGDGGVCVDSEGYKYCLPACGCDGFATACPPNQACFESFNGYPQDKPACVPGNAYARDGDPCAGFYDCYEYSICRNDALEYPGGECQTYGCTIGDDSTCNGGHCRDINPPFTGTVCVDTCAGDGDCRQDEGYRCYDPGDGPSYCRHPHVGDACETADDCGGGTWTCLTGSDFPGGYCTVVACPTAGSLQGCSPGSVCHDPLVGENYCVDRCRTGDIGTQGTCRDGYLCVDTDPSLETTTGGCVPSPL